MHGRYQSSEIDDGRDEWRNRMRNERILQDLNVGSVGCQEIPSKVVWSFPIYERFKIV